MTRYKLVSCLLAVTLLVQLLFPLHLHLRHVDTPEPHGHEHHVIDFHPVAYTHASENAAHQDDHELASSPEALIKKILDRDSGPLLLVCLLLLTTLALIGRRWIHAPPPLTHTLYYGLAPPLRAPPARLS